MKSPSALSYLSTQFGSELITGSTQQGESREVSNGNLGRLPNIIENAGGILTQQGSNFTV